MEIIHPEYIINNAGQKVSVVLPIDEFNHLMEELEELYDIRLYDEAKARNEPSIPIDEAFKIIEENRRQKK